MKRARAGTERGFSLVEAMTVLFVVGLLAVVAFRRGGVLGLLSAASDTPDGITLAAKKAAWMACEQMRSQAGAFECLDFGKAGSCEAYMRGSALRCLEGFRSQVPPFMNETEEKYLLSLARPCLLNAMNRDAAKLPRKRDAKSAACAVRTAAPGSDEDFYKQLYPGK